MIGIDQLNSFLTLLKENGFTIDVQSYKDSVDLLPHSVDNKNSFKNYFSALVCKNQEQQEFFGQLYDNYFFDKLSDPPLAPFPYKKIIIIIISFLTIGFVSWFIFSKPFKIVYTPEKVLSQPYQNYSGEKQKIHVDSIIENQDKIRDLQIRTELDDATIADSLVSFRIIGKHKLQVKIKSESRAIDTSFHYNNIYIAHQKHLLITADKEKINLNEKVTYTSPIDTSITTKPYWIINDDTLQGIISGNKSSITTSFSRAGENIITIEYNRKKDSLLSKFSKEFYSANYTENVLSNYTIDLKSEPNPNLIYTINPTYIVVLAILSFLLIIIPIILYFIYKRKRSSKIKNFKKNIKYTGNQKPYNLKFRNKEQHIKSKGDLVKIANELKKQIQDNIFSVDKKSSIQKTIQNKGLLTIVKSAKSKQRQYLVLINEEYTNSQQLKLFQYLINKLLLEQVIIDFYFYHKKPTSFYNENYHTTFSIGQLHDLHYNADLIVMSKGNEFLAFDKPEVESTFKNHFSHWEKRILVTPLSQTDWSHNEIYLKDFFSLIPADIEGLMHLVQLLNNQIEISQINKLHNQYESKFINFEDITSLRKYFKNDETIFQWICALACFPRLDWNVILSIGDLILGENYNLNYTLLLRITRIDWMHSGSIPSNLRFKLLKELTKENELKTRTLLIELLNDYPTDETMFSFEEKRVNEINNNFILYASNYKTDERTKLDHDIFIEQYNQKNILDFSLLKYIEKKETDITKHGGEWDTPIKNRKNQSISVNDYIENITNSEDKKQKKWMVRTFITILSSLLPLLLVLLLYSYEEEIYQSSFNDKFKIIETKFQPSTITFLNNECSNLLAKNTKENTAFLIKNSKDSIQIILNKKKTFEIQNDSLIKVNAKIGKDIIGLDIPVLMNRIYYISIQGEKCLERIPKDIIQKKDTIQNIIYLQYYPDNTKESVQKFQEKLMTLGFRAEKKLDNKYAKKSEVRYFYDSDKKTADTLAELATKFFNQSIKAVKLNRKPVKQIEVWIHKEDVPNPCASLQTAYNKYILYFDYDKSNINRESVLILEKIIKRVKNEHNTKITIIGYSDEGSDAYDVMASMRMGKSTADYLIKNGLSHDNITVKGYGKSGIINKACKRVEILLTEITEDQSTTASVPETKNTGNILWLDDHPENNQKVIENFRYHKIRVDAVSTNMKAMDLISKNNYDFFIIDIARDNNEISVKDKNRAGLELIINWQDFLYSSVGENNDKAKIIIYSPSEIIKKYQSELLENEVKHFYSDFDELENYIFTTLKYKELKK